MPHWKSSVQRKTTDLEQWIGQDVKKLIFLFKTGRNKLNALSFTTLTFLMNCLEGITLN